MESKNLTKSFGVRVPLDLYMQMLKVSTENKLTITDLCLYSIMNSSIPNGKLNFKKGGVVDTEKDDEIGHLNLRISRMLTAMKKLEEENKRLLEEIRKEIENKETYKEAFKDTMNELKQYRSDYPKKK